MISAELTPVSSLSSLIAAFLGSSPSSIPPYINIITNLYTSSFLLEEEKFITLSIYFN